MAQENKIKKPQWLEILERQSWEAELIMSGLAIFGSISTFAFVDMLIQKTVVFFDDRILDILAYAFLYIYVAVTIVVISFIVHFALRLLWVGTLGLSSVYPKGINVNNSAYTPSFLEKAKNEFPNLSDYSLKLDKSCSIIFSILCMSVLMLVSITVWILIYLVITEILTIFISDEIMVYIGWTAIALFYVYAIIISLLTTGRFKNSSFAEKHAYKWTKKFSKIMSLGFYVPINYISYTIRTNVSTKKFMIGMVIILFTSMIFSIPKYGEASKYYSSNNYFVLNQRAEMASDKNYLDALKDDYILSPIIQSKVIKDDYLILFIPRYKREEVYREALCGEFIKDETKNKSANRIDREKFRNQCASTYYQVLLNDKPLNGIDFRIIQHSHNDEKGYEAYIPISELSSGRHQLKIKTAYKNEEGEFAVRLIPFYKQ